MENVKFLFMGIVLDEMAILWPGYHFLPAYSSFFNPIEIKGL
jgi:hypothetical protein